MNLHSLKPANGATKKSKRIGRGQGSGKGGTSTKGHNGAQSRAGYSRKIGFEGGQMPIYRLVPKRGFKNINRVEYSAINLSTLQQLVEKCNTQDVNLDTLISNGLAKKKSLIKILGKGELTHKINVTAHAFSATAKEAIEKIGGTATVIGFPKTEEVVETPKAAKAPKVKEEVVETPVAPVAEMPETPETTETEE